MYGNTHAIATAIAGSISRYSEVRIVPVSEATDDLVAWADLVVAGAPTHARGMPTARSRSSAVDSAAKPDGWSHVTLDPSAKGVGIREWLDGLRAVDGKRAAAFDTRAAGPALITGRASTGIAKQLRDHGFTLVADPESFIIDTHQQLRAGEEERAASWASSLAEDLVPTA
jgi:hypothetical protein